MANSNSIINIKNFFDRHKGLQRTNRFSMSLSLPESLPQVLNEDLYPLAVTIGSRAIDGIADNLAGYGLGRTVPRSQKFPQGVLLTFAITNDNFIPDFFNNWFNAIYSGGRQKGYYGAPFTLQYYDKIILDAEMDINLLDPNGNINRTYTFYEIYPLENLPLTLDMMESNKYLTYQVLMNFRDFTISTP